MNLCDLGTIKNIMQAFGINFRKELGQNFLTNGMVVSDIADSCSDDAHSTVLEVGPGIGVLTKELAERYEKVISLEIDKNLLPVLAYTLGDYKNVEIINEDVMKTDLEALLAPYFEKGSVSVCANLPYYITTPILMKLLESRLPFDAITIMIQSEVADRLCAKAGKSDYGAITAVLAYYGIAERLFTVTADNFVPAPKVDSAVVRIKLYKEIPYKPKSEEMMFRTIKAAFEQRRKTLSNALANGFGELTKDEIKQIIEDCGHRPDIRGEKLDIAEFVTLSDVIFDKINSNRA
ncbi:MAG: 16S rRNA (adenine(1518)-N(6)/adenine(1519)-N(6))-dimethyltransferase RsmA [Ruminococcaceae bacterium]|nr:16S rRNA (adenine(1518)-N(6)/adenine(1519)-N(6))-dimethyltransferase RsmA [Oscillospiraceae bacterium]